MPSTRKTTKTTHALKPLNTKSGRDAFALQTILNNTESVIDFSDYNLDELQYALYATETAFTIHRERLALGALEDNQAYRATWNNLVNRIDSIKMKIINDFLAERSEATA